MSLPVGRPTGTTHARAKIDFPGMGDDELSQLAELGKRFHPPLVQTGLQ